MTDRIDLRADTVIELTEAVRGAMPALWMWGGRNASAPPPCWLSFWPAEGPI